MKKLIILFSICSTGFTAGYTTPQIDTLKINKVVVVGYGKEKSSDKSVGSIISIDNEKLKNNPTTNLLDALSGKVAGLSVVTSSGAPNSVPSIRLRGVGSVNASSEPLFVIDGVPMDSRFALTFNPNDIESVSVLKDASATSIYGARGAGGVILIKTKLGAYNSKPIITFSGGYSFNSVIESKLNPMTTSEHTDFMVTAGIIPNDYAEGLRALGNYDWEDLLYNNNAPSYEANFSVAGGSKNTKYHFSASYFDSEGVVVGSGMDKFTFRSNIDSRINDYVKAGVNLAVGHYKADNIMSNVDDGLFFTDPVIGALMIPSYQTPNDDNGNPLLLLPYTNQYPSPLTMPEQFPRNENEFNLNGNAFVEVNPIKNLTLRSVLGGSAYDFEKLRATSPLYPHSGGLGEVDETLAEYYSWITTNTAEYNFSLNKHYFGILLGQESIYNSLTSRELFTSGISNKDIVNIGSGLSSTVPTYTESVSTFNSLFARLDYNLNDTYFLDLSLRNDASSRFSKANRNALFYSVGAMVNLKKWKEFAKSQTISKLNIRASYGTSGNAGIGDYEQYATLSNVIYGTEAGLRMDNSGNSNLKWEKQGLFNVGAQVELFDRYSISLEYYNRTTNDMLLEVPLSGTTGHLSEMKNAGSMRNSGIDMTIYADVFSSKDWSVGVGANFNYNKNEILSLFDDNISYPDGEANILQVGSSYGTYYMQEWLGVDPTTGQGMYNDGAGGITYSAQTAPTVMINETWIAPYSGGLNLNVSYKKLSLVIDATYAYGRKLWNRNLFFTENLMFASPYANQSTGILDYWKSEGDNAYYPSLDWQRSEGGMQYLSSHTLEDASYFRIKNIQLSYDVTSFAKVWVSARNLFTFTKFRGIDPELDRYVATDDYPNTRQITIGVELKF